MVQQSVVAMAAGGLLVVLTIVTLGISIGTLVKVNSLPSTGGGSDGGTTRAGRVNTTAGVAETTAPIGTETTLLTTTTTPAPPAPAPNIPSLPISTSDKYRQAAQYFASNMNTSRDPCNNFYEYACDNLQGPMYFDVAQTAVYDEIIAQLETVDAAAPVPVQQFKQVVDACVQATTSPDTGTPKYLYAVQEVMAFETASQFPFPFLEGTKNPQWPTATALGTAVGYLSASAGVDTILPYTVMTNWLEPIGASPYLIYFSPPQLGLPLTFYDDSVWDTIRDTYIKQIEALLLEYASVVPVQIDQAMAEADATAIADFEYLVAGVVAQAEFLSPSTGQQKDVYNLVSLKDAETKWGSYISVKAVLQSMSANAPADVQKRVSDDDYNVDFYYPAIMDALSTVLAAGNTAGVDARTLYNWFYYMTIQNFQRFLPSSAASSRKLTFEEMLKEHRRSVERHSDAALDKILERKKKQSDAVLRRKEVPWEDADLADTDPQDIKRSCVQQNADRLEFASSRVYVDAVLPTKDERAKIRGAAGQLLTEILVAFQSMIDQLDWMSDSSKGAAYAKIDNIYRNLGYSDIAVDDAKLTSYYKSLSFPAKADYEGMKLELARFGLYSQLANLARSGGTDRTSFAGFSAATVNAFYQPMMNSITLPLAILQQPFFDADWPTSVNHGAMGVVLGHELTHGFDNQGVQWDSTGKLDNWLDPASQQAFDKMAQCVIDQYSGFCPLDGDKYKPNCIDGAQTQGENIADNGAIRASFRAYRNVIGLNGPDPRLPGSLVSQYSHDQLYFLGFANVWCDHETDDEYENQIKQDSHSPGKYRVLGALQNYQEFRSAFRCPAGSEYAPEKHCNVWISNSTEKSSKKDTLNIPALPVSSSAKYQQASQYFASNMNTSWSPCDNFYEYACDKFSGTDDYFTQMQKRVLRQIGGYLNGLDETSKVPKPVLQFELLVDQCVVFKQNPGIIKDNGKYVKQAVSDFKTKSSLNFPFDDPTLTYAWPTAKQLGYAVGYLAGSLDVQTLLPFQVDTNWLEPIGKQPYLLYLTYPNVGQDWGGYSNAQALSAYVAHIQKLFLAYAQVEGKTVDAALTASALEFAKGIANLERTIVKMINDLPFTSQADFYNPVTIGDAQTQHGAFVDFESLITEILANAPDAAKKAVTKDYKIDLYTPTLLDELKKLFADGNTYGVTPADLYNYLYYMILQRYDGLMPAPTNSKKRSLSQAIKKRQRDVREKVDDPLTRILSKGKRRPIVDGGWETYEPLEADADDLQLHCIGETMDKLQYASGRAYVDVALPTEDSKKKIRDSANHILTEVLVAFQSMIDQLDWMSSLSKKAAYAKIANIAKNIGYNDFIVDDAKLEDHYKTLDFSASTNYIEMSMTLRRFMMFEQFSQLALTDHTDRTYFAGFSPATVNAFYQPELNSITLPLAILQQPYFDADWPTSVNHGAMGIVLGHELTHGFDNSGVQWDSIGKLNNWLDDDSQKAFDKMAQCVIDEYSGFCPLDPSQYSVACINGAQTQGENIADNGAIRASFRAYRNIIGLNGPEPRLPGSLVSQYSHDQLYFLSFANIWCDHETDDQYEHELIYDVHSPGKYRILGSLQNYQEFRSAFSCPAGSVYAPEKHCNVWISNSTTQTGMAKDSPNIPSLPVSSSTPYKQVAQQFSVNMNRSRDPCNNFFEYACDGFNNKNDYFVQVQQKTLKDMADYLHNLPPSTPHPVQQFKQMVDACVLDRKDPIGSHKGRAKYAVQDVNELKAVTSFPFPLLDNAAADLPWPSPADLGKALGYQNGVAGIPTLLPGVVQVNTDDPDSEQPYFVVGAESKLGQYLDFYTDDWDTYKYGYIKDIEQLMMKFAEVDGRTLDLNTLNADATAIADFEHAVASIVAKAMETTPTTASDIMFTVKQSEDRWGQVISVRALLLAMAQNAPLDVRTRVVGDSYKIVELYPQMLDGFKDLLKSGNTYGVSARALYNWLYYMTIQNDKDLLNSPAAIKTITLEELIERKLREAQNHTHDDYTVLERIMKGTFKSSPNMFSPQTFSTYVLEVLDAANDDELAQACVRDLMDPMQFASGRAYVDIRLPTDDARQKLINTTGRMLNEVLVAFQSMIDQLDWMSDASKAAAYAKIDNIYRNIAYPPFIVNDTLLEDHYRPMSWPAGSTYFDMQRALDKFVRYEQLSDLARMGSPDRGNFVYSPATVNAFYQPRMNSITLPLAILQPPFFDPDWPTSVNHGAMGVVLGHELTHGFDNQGVQWDANGKYGNWLDPESQKAFDKMAKCVIDEYSAFCPLDPTYSPHCINGRLTQGENIADNGGVRASFRAYRNTIGMRGPDPLLPGGVLGQYSHDQLFFLSFSNVWCNKDSPDKIKNQLYDVHSPGKYRILGTLQNYPEFRAAFQCPADSTYGPEKHCNVWISEPATRSGPKKTPNIPSLPVSSDDKYQQAAQYFATNMNTTYNPCENFYEYACDAFSGSVDYFTQTQAKVIESIVAYLDKLPATAPKPVQQWKQLIDQCVVYLKNPEVGKAGGIYVKRQVDTFKQRSTIKFPFIEATTNEQWPTAATLGFAVGYLGGFANVDALLPFRVDTNWKAPDSDQPYLLYFRLAKLGLYNVDYQDKYWPSERDKYIKQVQTLLLRFAKAYGVKIDDALVKTAKDDATGIADFEHALATIINNLKMDTIEDLYNVKTVGELKASYDSFMDISALLTQVLINAPADVQTLITNDNYQVDLYSPAYLDGLMNLLKAGNSASVTPRQLYNYLYYSIIRRYETRLPEPTVTKKLSFLEAVKRKQRALRNHGGDPLSEMFQKRKPRSPDVNRPAWEVLEPLETDDAGEARLQCVEDTMDMLQYASGRAYVDVALPTDASRKNMGDKTGRMLAEVLVAFQSMIDQLDWMGESSKKEAYAKIANIAKNIGYNDFIVDDAQLEDHYKALDFSKATTYIEYLDALNKFLTREQLVHLARTKAQGTDRTNFAGSSPATVNAFYQPRMNSITLPLAILQQPFFDPDWPTSVNHGAMGIVLGHELTHGFDNSGVQWDSIGALRNWLDAASQTAFNNMAQCVIKEYDQFCPLKGKDPSKYPYACIDGAQTQGENIADNGGARAAFRAYRNVIGLNGPDPLLPGYLTSQYTHDQLYFLSFANVWCDHETDDETEDGILTDVHSPAKYRILGTLRNYPEFRSAFRCTAGSAYAPDEHCNVWISSPKYDSTP